MAATYHMLRTDLSIYKASKLVTTNINGTKQLPADLRLRFATNQRRAQQTFLSVVLLTVVVIEIRLSD